MNHERSQTLADLCKQIEAGQNTQITTQTPLGERSRNALLRVASEARINLKITEGPNKQVRLSCQKNPGEI